MTSHNPVPEHPTADPPRSLLMRIWRQAEGKIFLIGVFLAMLLCAGIALIWLYSPEDGQKQLGMVLTHICFGRAAGLSFGYAMKLGNIEITGVNMLIECVMVLLFYPLFILFWRKMLIIESLKEIMQATRDAAEKNRSTIRKYGIIGLFLFVWFPFWATGPIVGCAIGYIIGLRHWVNLSVVLGGTFVAILCWAMFFREVHERVAHYGPYASMLIVVGVILVIVIGHVLTRSKNNTKA